jgi:hypothetical protein
LSKRAKFVAASAAALLVAGIAATSSSAATAPKRASGGLNTDAAASAKNYDTSRAVVEINGESTLDAAARVAGPSGQARAQLATAAVHLAQAQATANRVSFASWLKTAAPRARILKSEGFAVNYVSVALNGTSLAQLSKGPNVKAVGYSKLFHPTADASAPAMTDPDLGLVSAKKAWNLEGGPGGAGAGVMVAIIDRGIEITNP